MKVGTRPLRLLLRMRRLFDAKTDETRRRKIIAKMTPGPLTPDELSECAAEWAPDEALVDKLTKAIERVIKIPVPTTPLTSDNLAELAKVGQEFGRNIYATLERHSGIATYSPHVRGDWLKFFQMASIATELTLHEMEAKERPRFNGAKGGKKAAKTRKAKADERHAEAEQMIAEKQEKSARSGRRSSTRKLALDVQHGLKKPLSQSTLERLIRKKGAKK